jgi:hypothetical protein
MAKYVDAKHAGLGAEDGYLGDPFLGAKSTDMSVLGCSCVTFEK